MGFPNQVWVQKKFSLDSFYDTFNGKVPIFVSTYQFKDKYTPIVNSMFFDIDSYFSVRMPYRNTQKLIRLFDTINVPYIINFSGGKGFHVFGMFKPETPKTEEEKQQLRNLLYSVQLAIANKVGLEAYDGPTLGRIRFLVRYPTSRYLRMNEETNVLENNNLYCRNLSLDEFNLGLKKISKLVKEPGDMPKEPQPKRTLKEIAKSLDNFKLKERKSNNFAYIRLERTSKVVPSVCAVGLPCLKKIASNPHPKHQERIELVSFLKIMGYSDMAITSFIQGLHWLDYKYPVTSYQVSTVKPRFPNCKYLRESYGAYCGRCSLK